MPSHVNRLAPVGGLEDLSEIGVCGVRGARLGHAGVKFGIILHQHQYSRPVFDSATSSSVSDDTSDMDACVAAVTQRDFVGPLNTAWRVLVEEGEQLNQVVAQEFRTVGSSSHYEGRMREKPVSMNSAFRCGGRG